MQKNNKDVGQSLSNIAIRRSNGHQIDKETTNGYAQQFELDNEPQKR